MILEKYRSKLKVYQYRVMRCVEGILSSIKFNTTSS